MRFKAAWGPLGRRPNKGWQHPVQRPSPSRCFTPIGRCRGSLLTSTSPDVHVERVFIPTINTCLQSDIWFFSWMESEKQRWRWRWWRFWWWRWWWLHYQQREFKEGISWRRSKQRQQLHLKGAKLILALIISPASRRGSWSWRDLGFISSTFVSWLIGILLYNSYN